MIRRNDAKIITLVKRPADLVGKTVLVMRIATRQVEEDLGRPN
jgi:hypothetical protein